MKSAKRFSRKATFPRNQTDGKYFSSQNTIPLDYFQETKHHFIDCCFCASFLQVVLWFIMPAISSPNYNIKNTTFGLVIVVQYIIRMYLIVPLSNQIIKAAGVVAKTAWGGAAYNLLLYMLASHVCHSIQYILLQNHLFTHSSLQNPNFHICPSEI